jgi:hypothetical protein
MSLVTATSNGSFKLMENNTAKITHTHTHTHCTIDIYNKETVFKKFCNSALVGFLACSDAELMPILPVLVADA